MPEITFPQQVYALTRRIPKGKVATYLNIAKKIGRAGAARAVGNALNKNPYAPQVPCHRVVRSNREVGGFASGPAKKIRLLQAEGVKIVKGRIADNKYFYDF